MSLTNSVVPEPLLPAKFVRQVPVSIDTLLTKAQFILLIKHMLNGNPLSHFLTVWRDPDGNARFAKAKPHRDAETHAGWTYDTITGNAKRKTSMGLYPKNKANESTWGALDFDAHEHGQDELAKNRAIRAFTLMLEYRDRYLILSASGRGYHVFILANEPRPVAEWTNLLKDTCESIDAPIQDGVCEIFPNDRTANQEVGRAIRVPGSLNPSTGEIELILADTIRPLLDYLERQEEASKSATLTSNSLAPRQLVRDKEVNNYSYQHRGGFASSSTQRLIDEVLAKYPITKRGTRNAVLAKLIGELYHKFGFQLSEHIVAQHYELYRDNVTTGRDDHMREFRNAWRSFCGKKEKEMTGSERLLFDKLQTEPQREAFLLCRSFATLKKEFPVPQSSLADRIGLTQQGAGYVIARLIKVGAIRKTAEAKTNRQSAYYRWNAHLPGRNTATTPGAVAITAINVQSLPSAAFTLQSV
jgi:TOTE conflict system, Archaeo-Eukaryotic Primase domain